MKNKERSDVHQQLTGVSSEGLGLIKLFLMNTNNINNHSVNLDNHKSDFEPGLVLASSRHSALRPTECLEAASLVPK